MVLDQNQVRKQTRESSEERVFQGEKALKGELAQRVQRAARRPEGLGWREGEEVRPGRRQGASTGGLCGHRKLLTPSTVTLLCKASGMVTGRYVRRLGTVGQRCWRIYFWIVVKCT